MASVSFSISNRYQRQGFYLSLMAPPSACVVTNCVCLWVLCYDCYLGTTSCLGKHTCRDMFMEYISSSHTIVMKWPQSGKPYMHEATMGPSLPSVNHLKIQNSFQKGTNYQSPVHRRPGFGLKTTLISTMDSHFTAKPCPESTAECRPQIAPGANP